MVFGIRPEDIYDNGDACKSDTAQAFNATVDVSELIGSETYLYVSVGNQSLVARVESHTTAKIGLEHQFVLNTAKIHLFDKETEKVIK